MVTAAAENKHKSGLILPLILLYLLTASLLPAQPTSVPFTPVSGPDRNISDWFTKQPGAQRYLAYRQELQQLFDTAAQSGLPAWLLIEKLNEGVSKAIRGDKLILALQQTLLQLTSLKMLLEKQQISAQPAETYAQSLKTLGVYLQGGLEAPLLEELLTSAKAAGLNLTEMLLLGETILKIRQASELSQEMLLRMGESILGSTVPPPGYPAIAALFAKGKIRHMKDESLLQLINTVLDAGGGLIQLNDEFNRRIGRR